MIDKPSMTMTRVSIDLQDLPPELLSSLNTEYPCRPHQIHHLATLLSSSYPPVPAIVLTGLASTGKTVLTRSILQNLHTPHVIIDSGECITGRHLLEKTLSACVDAVEEYWGVEIEEGRYGRCESVNALSNHLERLLGTLSSQGRGVGKFVIVFDGVDGQREAPPGLVAGLCRLGELISNLSVVLVKSQPRPAELHKTGVPHIHFPTYAREEILQILNRDPLPICSPENSEPVCSEDDTLWLWTRFTTTLYESQARHTSRTIPAFRRLAAKIWPLFTAPVMDGSLGPRDFSKLILANRSLFQNEDLLTSRICPVPSPSQGQGLKATEGSDLPYYTRHLLVASYLASYNPPRTDMLYFSKSSERRKRRRKSLGGGKPGRKAVHRKIPRALLAPSPFGVERLLAIFHAIVPHAVKSGVDLCVQFATLVSLRLVVRAGMGGDVLDVGAKWKVNCSLDFVRGVGRSVRCEVGEWCFEG